MSELPTLFSHSVDVAGLRVVVHRGRTVNFESLPDRSIALDGYVLGPKLDPDRERYSFDHHGACVRLATNATCRQVLDALILGLDPSRFTIYVNDLDADVALSLFLLSNTHLVLDPRVAQLVDVVAAADAHGPAYALRDAALLKGFARALSGVTIGAGGALGREQLCASVLASSRFVEIECLIDDAEGEILDVETCITHRGSGWVMIRTSRSAFHAAYWAGYRRVIAYQPDVLGTWSYTVARQSDFVSSFPIESPDGQLSIMACLRARESGWGGSSTIGGAPRRVDGSRSHLAPDVVFNIVESFVKVLLSGTFVA